MMGPSSLLDVVVYPALQARQETQRSMVRGSSGSRLFALSPKNMEYIEQPNW